MSIVFELTIVIYTGEPEVLDVRSARLEGASLWCASAAGAWRVAKRGAPLLTAPKHLTFTIEQNITQRSRAGTLPFIF